jgi:hypothetical protein
MIMGQTRNRLFIDKNTDAKEREKLIKLALENECNTLVFSLDDPFFTSRSRNKKYMKLLITYPLNIEAGGHDLPLLLPKNLFLFKSDLFRMEQGKRNKNHHFCSTNPKTTTLIAERAQFFFANILQLMTAPRIFHLLPDKGHENTWCQCPACRAFRPAEQYLIAVNTAADVLTKIDPEAKIAYIDFDSEPDAARVKPRKNTIITGKGE